MRGTRFNVIDEYIPMKGFPLSVTSLDPSKLIVTIKGSLLPMPNK